MIAIISLWIAGLAVRDVFFSHIVLVLLLGAVVVPVLIGVLVPGGLGIVRTVLGVVARFLFETALGGAVLGCLVTAIVTWEARGMLDSSIELRRQLMAQQAEAKRALDDEKARAATSALLAAQARAEAESQRAVAKAAADRSRAAETERDDLAQEVEDYADRLASAEKAHPRKGCAHRFVLSPAEAAGLARIGEGH